MTFCDGNCLTIHCDLGALMVYLVFGLIHVHGLNSLGTLVGSHNLWTEHNTVIELIGIDLSLLKAVKACGYKSWLTKLAHDLHTRGVSALQTSFASMGAWKLVGFPISHMIFRCCFISHYHIILYSTFIVLTASRLYKQGACPMWCRFIRLSCH